MSTLIRVVLILIASGYASAQDIEAIADAQEANGVDEFDFSTCFDDGYANDVWCELDGTTNDDQKEGDK